MKLVVSGFMLALCGLVQARTVNVESGTEELSESLSGDEALVKTGSGTLVLTGANSGWFGAIDIQAGTLKSEHARLGTGDISVGSDGTLMLTGTAVIPSKPTRKLSLGGALKSDGFKLSNPASDWYPFADTVLTGDATTDVMQGMGWGNLDMNGHRLTVIGDGRIEFPRMVIANPGTIAKVGGYLVFRGMELNFGEGGELELSGGCTLDMTECGTRKCLFKIHSVSGNNWFEVSGGASVWAGPIEIEADSTLMSWFPSAVPCVVEGPISGAGEFRTSSESGKQPTILRGSAVSDGTGTVRLYNNDLQVENYAALPPLEKLHFVGSGNLRLIGCTSEQIADVGNRAMFGDKASGRVVPVIPVGTEQEIVPSPAIRLPADGGSACTTTNVISQELLSNVVSANYGTWTVGGFPDAVNSLGSLAYGHGTTVFRDAGDLTWTSWVAGLGNAPSNAVAPRIRFEGDTRALIEGRLYAGYGNTGGLGIVEVASNATVEACLQVGCTAERERGAVYQTGGTIVHAFNPGNLGGGAGSSGYWIQRGGVTVVSNDLMGANGYGTYGAYVLHGGELRVAPSGRLLFGRNGRFHFYVGGGTVTNENAMQDKYPMSLNADGSSDGHAEASFTMDGADARFVSLSRFDTWKRDSITHYNFNAGEFVCPMLFIWGPEAGYANAKIHVGFNGGTWRLLPASSYLFCYDPKVSNCRPTSFVVYEGGCTIATRDSGEVRAGCPIDAPTGLGVKSVTLPEKIGGLAVSDWQAIGPLRLWFEGGNGSADAMVDFDERTGETKGVKVLCSGFGYVEAPTAYVVSPDGSCTNTCVVEMFEPKGGDFTKRGKGTFVLDEPCSYTGRTIIEEGELRFLTADTVPPAPDVTIAAGADLWPPVGIVLDTLRGNGVSWYNQSVTNRLVVSYADVTNGVHLKVKGGVLNLVDAKIVVPDLADVAEDAKSVTLAEAENGIAGTFAFDVDEVLSALWQVRRVGNRLRLVNCSRGMTVIVR